jgi:2-oxoisovalerate dehydrogenase E2 component (dihydrolipoyl transacylase)
MQNVKLYQMGESVEEGTLCKWLKNVGDYVSIDDPLVEVITDKVNVEMLSDFEGELSEILVKEGQTALIGQVICRILEKAG